MAALTLSASVSLTGCRPSEEPQGAGAPGYQAPQSLVVDQKKLAAVIRDLPASSPQRPLLEDGIVSKDELARSWTRLRSCLQAGGLAVTGPYPNPITNTEYLYTYARREAYAHTATTDAAADTVDRRCEDTYWTPVSLVYAANTPQRLDARLARYLVDCMARARYETVRPTTFDDIARNGARTADRARLGAAYECLDAGMPALFPQLPYFPRP